MSAVVLQGTVKLNIRGRKKYSYRHFVHLLYEFTSLSCVCEAFIIRLSKYIIFPFQKTNLNPIFIFSEKLFTIFGKNENYTIHIKNYKTIFKIKTTALNLSCQKASKFIKKNINNIWNQKLPLIPSLFKSSFWSKSENNKNKKLRKICPSFNYKTTYEDESISITQVSYTAQKYICWSGRYCRDNTIGWKILFRISRKQSGIGFSLVYCT